MKVNSMFQWRWNASGKMRASTWCRNGSSEGNADACYNKGLVDTFTTSFGVVNLFGTHEKAGQHDYE
jgi:hypothetical protein